MAVAEQFVEVMISYVMTVCTSLNKSSANDTDISPHSFMADLIAKTTLSACDSIVCLI